MPKEILQNPERVRTALLVADNALKIIKEEGALNSNRINGILYDIAGRHLPLKYKTEISKILQMMYSAKLERIYTLEKRLGVKYITDIDRGSMRMLYYLDDDGLRKWFDKQALLFL